MTRPRRSALVLLTILALVQPSWAVLPPQDPDSAIPAVALEAIRDGRDSAYAPAHPLAGVVPANIAARQTAGALSLDTLSGTFDYPVLLGRFADTATDPWPKGDLEDQLFQQGYTGLGRPGSLRDYFDEVSYDQYSVDGTVYDWASVSLNAADYAGADGCFGLCESETSSAAAFVSELLALDDPSVDFTAYDNDGPDGMPNSGDDDGVVDLLVVVQPQEGAECGSAGLWSHLGRYSDTFGASYTTDDAASAGGNILVEDYIVVPAYDCDASSLVTIGPFAYLFGVHLGLAPLWDRDGGSRGIGAWGLMGRGSWGGDGVSPDRPVHLGAYSKAILGWTIPDVVSGNEPDASIPAAENSSHAREFRRAESCAHEEYFLIENRQPTGFDQDLPGDGLVIWHVDENAVHADEEARALGSIVQADARYGLLNDAPADAGDSWPGSVGRSSWREDTDPNSLRWDARPSGVSVNAISVSGDPMTATLTQDTDPALAITAVEIDDALPGLGDADGAIDPYETVRITVSLANDGQTAATAVSGTLSLNPTVAGVTITDDTATWPDFDPCGVSLSEDFEISLDASVDCETELNFDLALTYSEGSVTRSFSLMVGELFTADALRMTSAAEDAFGPRSASTGSAGAVVYAETVSSRKAVRMSRLDLDGVALGTTDISAGSTGDAEHPDVEWNGTEYGVVWDDSRDGTLEIYFARVDSDGLRIGSELRVTTSAGDSRHPRIAWNDVDSEWGIVWQDTRGGSEDVYFARVDAGGSKVGGDVLVSGETASETHPDIAWSGTRFGMVWQDDGLGEWTIYYDSVDASGTLLGSRKRLEEEAGDSMMPAIAFNELTTQFGVVHIDHPDGSTRSAVCSARTDQDGTLPINAKIVDDTMERVDFVDVDSDGTSYYLGWSQIRDGRHTVRLLRADDRFNKDLGPLDADAGAPHGLFGGLDFGSGQIYLAWLEESADTKRLDAFARPANASFLCGRDDDGDGVNQPGDNCPQTSNPDQTDSDEDGWGDDCDCDDVDPDVNPGEAETICDGVDNDCSTGTPDAPDEDADGVDLCDVSDANNPDGVGIDCDDDDPLNYPGNTEVCDGQDNDCDATVDEDFPVLTWYRDADVDGYGDPNVTFDTCDGNNQGYVSDNTDCDDTRSDVNPGQLEACDDGADTDCDGTVDEVTGTRYLDPAGSDEGNDCTDDLNPCVGFNHAIHLACDGETVLVAEGSYTEDVVVDHPVVVDNSGLASQTFLNGTGTTDVVQILSADVTWDGVNAAGSSPTGACFRVGDATNTGIRGLSLRNTSATSCGVGIVLDSTGTTGSWNRILSMDVAGNVTDGSAGTGVGVLFTGGVGRVELKNGWVRNNEGAGIRVEAPPTGEENKTIVIVGNRIYSNGSDASADSHTSLEVVDGSDVRIEGNRIYDNVGSGSGDGIAVVLDQVDGGNVFCNRVEDNDRGLVLTGGATGLGVLHNNIEGNLDVGISIEAASGSATLVNENKIHGNLTGIDHDGDGTLDARHNWWGSDDGPGGAGPGTGDPVEGSLDTSNFVARSLAPLLVRRPVDFGWSESVAACYKELQNGIDAAVAGDLLLVGSGRYDEHVTLDKNIDLEGISGGAGCSPTEVDGSQSGGSHLPAMRISDVVGMTLRDMTFRSTGEGTVCGENTGDEIGLDLQNVDDSTFENLCFRENGVTELRVYGDSDNNTFRNMDFDGAIRLGDGTDVCGHRSREGILIDGGPACEGGPGASADGNLFEDLDISYVARGVSARLASGTEITDSTITASPAAAWDGGGYAVGITLEMADDTLISGNTIGAGEENDGIRVAGRADGSCVTERTDSTNTTITDNDIRESLDAGIRLYKETGDPGSPVNVQMECNDIHLNGTGLLSDYVGDSPASEAHTNNIRQNSEGVRNNGIRTLSATENYWNSSSGPSGSGPGTGDSVFGAVSYGPWLETNVLIDNDSDGYSECEGDCDDDDDALSPDASEVCDDIDNDCDGSIDEDLATNTYYRDQDGDGFGDALNTVEDCSGTPPDGYVTDDTDCDDSLDTVYPGAPEVACDGVDQSCDGSANEAPDGDVDGYDACDPTDPYDGDGLAGDCDDDNDQVNPGVSEVTCDGIDQDCSGADLTPDADEDGADICGPGDANNPDGIDADCDDDDPQRAPHFDEACDTIDNDCDGSVDEDLPLFTYYRDQDEDTYGDPATSVDDCADVPPAGYVTDDTDCDDTRPDINPGADEVCTDNLDNDCDGSQDAADATCSVLETANLRFGSGGKTTLLWDAASNADAYALYRGSIPEQGFGSYDHLCAGTEISGTTAEVVPVPPVGEAHYYVSTGLSIDSGSGAIVGGPLGSRSAGESRADSDDLSCGPRVYVDPDAAGAGNGLSWADAYSTMGAALSHSRASNRGLEVWLKGTVSESETAGLNGENRPGVMIYGGFAGSETEQWSRDPLTNPSAVTGPGSGVLFDFDGASASLDGLTIENAATGVAAASVTRLELREVTLQGFVDRGIDVSADRQDGTTLIVSESTFDGSAAQSLRAIVSAGILAGRVERSSFAGGSDAAIRVEARPGLFDAESQLGIVANRISGGASAIVLGAHVDDVAQKGINGSLVASNLIFDTTGDAILVEASGNFANESGAAEARAVPVILLNTVSDGGDAGIGTSATRSDSTADPSVHRVEAAPELWDNLLTHHAGNGVEESADDEATNLIADPLLFGNLFFGNGALYLDEGGTTLPAIGDVNALAGNGDNLDTDPLYTDRPSDDYTLDAASPAIDQGHASAPASVKIDVDGGPRSKDGDASGTAEPDLGAHER